MADYGNGGMLVNTSQNFVNAYTGEAQAFDANHTMDPQMKSYYRTRALKNARPKMVFAQFGKKQPLPNGNGTTVEWRKRNKFADVGRLIEGVIPKGKKFGYSMVTADIYEYGDYTAITKWLMDHAIDPVKEDASAEIVAAGYNTLDKLVRNELLTGTNVMYAPKGDGTEVTSRADLDDTCIMTTELIARVVAHLAAADAPRIGGAKAVCVTHPFVIHDIMMNNPDWVEAHKYADPKAIFNGEVGMYMGVRFVDTTNAKVYKARNLAGNTANLAVDGAVQNATVLAFDGGAVGNGDLVGRAVTIGGTECIIMANTENQMIVDRPITANDNAVIAPEGGGADGTAAFASIFLTEEAYGIIDPEAGGLDLIIKNPNEVGGPLNQFGTVGVKFSTGAKILYEENIVRVESGSTLGNVAEGN